MENQAIGSDPQSDHELDAFKNEWIWFMILGIGLAVLGVIAVGSSFFVSVVTVVLFGVLLLAGGVAQIISSFWTGKWSGFLLHLLVGILYVVGGMIIVDTPVKATLNLTLLIAFMLIISGIFRIVAAMTIRFSHWGWTLLNGVVSVLLGVLIYKQWPADGLWVIGLFVGIELVFNGVAWIMLGVGLRQLARAESKAA